MKNVDCEVIQDLLPSYIDKVSSKETNKLVKNHLLNCKKCYMIFEEMKKKIPSEILENQEEIDFLKGYRRNKIRTVLFAIILTIDVLLFITLFPLIMLVFDENLEYNVDVNDINVEYMYMTKDTSGNNNLRVYLYSDEYIGLGGSEYAKVGRNGTIPGPGPYTGYTINNGITEKPEPHLKVVVKHFWRQKIYKETGLSSGLYHSFVITDNIDRIWLEDKKGHIKEIWNKDMKVMTEEEWKKWYDESYVPTDIKNSDIYNVRFDTGIWRHKYLPKTKTVNDLLMFK